jgi:hypothetical protein
MTIEAKSRASCASAHTNRATTVLFMSYIGQAKMEKWGKQNYRSVEPTQVHMNGKTIVNLTDERDLFIQSLRTDG